MLSCSHCMTSFSRSRRVLAALSQCFDEQAQHRILRARPAPAVEEEAAAAMANVDLSDAEVLALAKEMHKTWSAAVGKQQACPCLLALGADLTRLQEDKRKAKGASSSSVGRSKPGGASVCVPFQRALIVRPLQRLSLLSSGHCCTCSSVITILCVSYSIRRALRSRSAFCVLYLMKLHRHSGNSNAICYLLASFFSAISVSVLCFQSS